MLAILWNHQRMWEAAYTRLVTPWWPVLDVPAWV
jgi:hypothetical protein